MMNLCFNSKLTDSDLLKIAYQVDPTPKGNIDRFVDILRSVADEAALQAHLDAHVAESNFENSNFIDYFVMILGILAIICLISLVVILKFY